MSHHSVDYKSQGSGGSFWEPGNYKRITKRIEDGYKLCNDLQQLVQERADIEKGYAKSLRSWSKKWTELIEKCPEYGTMEMAWKGVLTEAEHISDVHLKIRENLCTEVSAQIKSWQKDSYHHTLMQIKERKDMEELFKKAQKPWTRLLAKVEKQKIDYHLACKSELSAIHQEQHAKADDSQSQEQLKKIRDRVQRCKDNVRKSRAQYNQALAEINKYNSVYIENMTSVFEKCKDIEKARLVFFKEVLFNIHASLDFTKNQCLPQIYEELYHTINNADHKKDLKLWTSYHGLNVAMNWPQFVEYSEDIANGGKSKETLVALPISLINQQSATSFSKTDSSSNASSKLASNAKSTMSSSCNIQKQQQKQYFVSTPSPTSAEGGAIQNATAPTASNIWNPDVANGDNDKTVPNPFEEEENSNDADSILFDNGKPGVPVKALYDYEGIESDELSFKQGDIFEKLEDEDEQGWCKGRTNGRVGLYPANYVEVIHT